MKDVLLMGGGGREASIAHRLIADDSKIILHAIMAHENPTIKNLVDQSGGTTVLGDPTKRELLLMGKKLHFQHR
jgi:phosphoribosylamine-glycine ligase